MKKIVCVLLVLVLMLSGCRSTGNKPPIDTPAPGGATDLGGDDTSFGDSPDDLGLNNGYFEGEASDVAVTCVSGTKNAYTVNGSTITFTAIGEDSVYAISGRFSGNIVIDVGDSHKFELELKGISLVTRETNPICIVSGDEVRITAKKDSENYIYDMRGAVDEANEALHSGAIHSEVDLEIAGKGSLTVVSENNNGIHAKDDLQVKNLTLTVHCVDNALKGNDSVEIESGTLMLIATTGDGIKTSNSDISDKGNQRGTIRIANASVSVYAACDGLDAAYDVIIENETTVLNIYTDKYSNYSKEVTATADSVFYIRYSSQKYTYSVKYINSESGAFEWINADYHSKTSGGRTTYYYYAFPKKAGYDKMQFFLYSSGTAQQQEQSYSAASDVMTIPTAYDTVALSNTGYSWTNYTTSVQGGGFGGGFGGGGFGGMQDGNTDKGDHSTKGIKAANAITIQSGTVNIKSYDDAIHAGDSTTLENGASPLGNVTINGGTITAYSNDDGLHADGTATVTAGALNVTNAYEGIEGTFVKISGGSVSIQSKDDGINGTTSSGTAIEISGGQLYIYCTGDGIDSNSRSSYAGIAFSGGNTVVISNSSMNSAIDSEQGYQYTGGKVIAIMPKGGMSGEATHCQNFSSVGKSTQISLTKDAYLIAEISGETMTVQMPVSLSAYVIVLGDSRATIRAESASSDAADVIWP